MYHKAFPNFHSNTNTCIIYSSLPIKFLPSLIFPGNFKLNFTCKVILTSQVLGNISLLYCQRGKLDFHQYEYHLFFILLLFLMCYLESSLVWLKVIITNLRIREGRGSYNFIISSLSMPRAKCVSWYLNYELVLRKGAILQLNREIIFLNL